MRLRRTAWLAMVGVVLRAVFYWVANLLPSWPAELPVDVRVMLVVVAVLDPLAWAAYFACVATRRPVRLPASLAIALGLLQVAVAAYRQYPTFSLLSLDSMAFLFGGVLPVACWSLVLLAQARGAGLPRASLWYLLLFAMFQVAMYTYSTGNSYQTIRDFGREEPFRLIVTPLIWLVYWVTQTLYVRAVLHPGQPERA